LSVSEAFVSLGTTEARNYSSDGFAGGEKSTIRQKISKRAKVEDTPLSGGLPCEKKMSKGNYRPGRKGPQV